MKTTLIKSTAIGAAIALLASLAFMYFAPRFYFQPVGILADTVFWPGVKVGMFVGERWLGSPLLGWAAGILTMMVIGAWLGLVIGLGVQFLRRRVT